MSDFGDFDLGGEWTCDNVHPIAARIVLAATGFSLANLIEPDLFMQQLIECMSTEMINTTISMFNSWKTRQDVAEKIEVDPRTLLLTKEQVMYISEIISVGYSIFARCALHAQAMTIEELQQWVDKPLESLLTSGPEPLDESD